MAYTFTPIPTMVNDVWGKTEVRFMQLQPAATDYPTGGYLITPGTNISLRAVYAMIPMGITATTRTTTVIPVYNTTTAKIQMFWSPATTAGGTISAPTFTGTPATLTGTNSAPTITTGTNATTTTPVYTNGGALTQVAGATGITGVQAPTLTMNSYTPAGTVSAPTFTGSAAAAAALAEVTASTDLSAWLFLFAVLGN